jgi:hypothetical protein
VPLWVYTHRVWVYTHRVWVYTHRVWIYTHRVWIYTHRVWNSQRVRNNEVLEFGPSTRPGR